MLAFCELLLLRLSWCTKYFQLSQISDRHVSAARWPQHHLLLLSLWRLVGRLSSSETNRADKSLSKWTLMCCRVTSRHPGRWPGSELGQAPPCCQHVATLACLDLMTVSKPATSNVTWNLRVQKLKSKIKCWTPPPWFRRVPPHQDPESGRWTGNVPHCFCTAVSRNRPALSGGPRSWTDLSPVPRVPGSSRGRDWELQVSRTLSNEVTASQV